ncbi:uncharacterized protein LAESUDRAFT_814646 [Laetiporus sulphureus 93-53]|uniref:Peptidase S9 prolyl oligopeptidase catalytic domain-containing protein n=1 Tax=Laetiporus sulphureus 93-53 TaxID=1314785 RepID=A0A165CW95_9APHY|nr:uncharacterized protein LAESUDRAFT_814646 [Laetiporus sulphureus 93-53]KZT03565.1 hypothetical protein LAESUDRAFT_814646 [Laetiporus sulphureus 93-53]
MLFLQSWISTILMCLLPTSAMANVVGEQVQRVFEASGDSHWRVSVSDDWDVLGPFPIHAREQHLLSPSFPINLTDQIDFNAAWPSSYADGGAVRWTTVRFKGDGELDVSFPNIRWESLRATEGWAALQHHSVLRSTVTVYPPSSTMSAHSNSHPRLLVNLVQGSFFTVIPRTNAEHSSPSIVPQWHAGNVYDMNRAPLQAVSFPTPPSRISPTTYDLFISGDYEIRLFGDPLYNGNRHGVPVLSMSLKIEIEEEPAQPTVALMSSHDVSCDFINGWAFGDALGIGVRSVSGWWTVKKVSLASHIDGLELMLVNTIRIAPTQTRIVPVRITQNASVALIQLSLDLHLVSGGASEILRVTLPVVHHALWNATVYPTDGIKASYFFAATMPTAFIVKPPQELNSGEPHPPVLALHGAGVDIISMPFWIQALPRQRRSWTIAPTGRTAWGLDWHGPSAQDAWSTVDALYGILQHNPAWSEYSLSENTRVLVLGHSNGGQGAWFLASRYPDRIVGVVSAAAYIKSQAYVPLTQSRAAHYIDPSMRAILESSLTPDDNDLFLSNLAYTPILAIHGGDDENVPVWHTREAVSVLKAWNPDANVTYREDSGQSHWYPTVFDNSDVQGLIRSILEQEPGSSHLPPPTEPRSFTLTVSIPAESGSLHGWRIRSLLVPGRLARLTVRMEGMKVNVQTSNVATFSVKSLPDGSELNVDESLVAWTGSATAVMLHFSYQSGIWNARQSSNLVQDIIQPSGRLSRILTTSAPLTIVIDNYESPHLLSAALRIANNLDLYHKIDADIIDDEEALRRQSSRSLGRGNIVVLGSSESHFLGSVLASNRSQFSMHDGSLRLKGRPLNTSENTALFLHPHPYDSDALMLVIHTDVEIGLERALRLVPVRTGITSPDFLILGDISDIVAAAGVLVAGVWGNDWQWNDAMSYF